MTVLCAERCTALVQGCHSLSSSLSEGDADVVYEMLGLCMQYRARNAEEAILAVHYRGPHPKPADCKEFPLLIC